MPPSMTPGSSIIVMVQSPMPTWPSPRSERLGTPKIPAIRFTRGTYFGASRFTYATACQVARPPLTDRTRSPRPQRAFTSRLPAVWSPSLPLGITTTWTGLLVLAGLAPAGMAASLAAPEPDVRHSRIRLYPKPMIRPPGADGTPGLIPDYLVATRSSLGYLHDAQIASSPIVGMF